MNASELDQGFHSLVERLYYKAPRRRTTARNTDGWGGFALACGAIGMPVILAAVCFTSLRRRTALFVA